MNSSSDFPATRGRGVGHFLKCALGWSAILALYFVAALFGRVVPAIWLLGTGVMACIVVAGLIRPNPTVGIGRPLSLLVGPLVIVIAAATFSPTYDSYTVQAQDSRLTQLRLSDPEAYGKEIAALRDVLPPDEFLSQVKRIDPALYQEEYKRAAKDKVVKSAEAEAAHSAALAQHRAAITAKLSELRKSDPQAYLKEIEGTPEWADEFKKLDPTGYTVWTQKRAEEAPATTSRASGREYYDQSMDVQKIGWMKRGMGAVRAMLKDSESAKFQDVFFVRGVDGIPLTCGEVNSKNSFGAYIGFQRFVSGGSANLTFLEEEVSDFANVWNRFCR